MRLKTASEPSPSRSLHAHALRECEAMARYALSSGLKVPGPILQVLEPTPALEPTPVPIAASIPLALSLPAVGMDTAEGDGEGISGEPATETVLGENSQTLSLQRLAILHGQLCDIIAPARPRTIVLLAEEAQRRSLFHFLGPVPLVRRMMLAAVLCLIGMIAFSLSRWVNGTAKSFDMFASHGTPLLLNEAFLLSAAGMGASFAALFTASRYIQEGTYDPTYEVSYWTRFILGLMAGMILAVLIPLNSNAPQGQNATMTINIFAKPLLALLGGFSASLVYRILNYVLAAVETLVRSDSREITTAREQVAKARSAEQSANARLQMLAQLSAVQQQFQSKVDPKDLTRELERLRQELVSPGSAGETSLETFAVVLPSESRLPINGLAREAAPQTRPNTIS